MNDHLKELFKAYPETQHVYNNYNCTVITPMFEEKDGGDHPHQCYRWCTSGDSMRWTKEDKPDDADDCVFFAPKDFFKSDRPIDYSKYPFGVE